MACTRPGIDFCTRCGGGVCALCSSAAVRTLYSDESERGLLEQKPSHASGRADNGAQSLPDGAERPTEGA